MAKRLLDTNIVSFLLKDHPLFVRYRPHLEGHSLAVSFMTVGELYEGAYRARWGKHRVHQMERLLKTISIIPSTPDMSRRWGQIRWMRRSQPIDGADSWIAATALTFGFRLVTHNPHDFRGIPGLKIIAEVSRHA